MKRPAFQFYPADWRKDPALSTCSIGARGLWIGILCIAHESDQYGHLTVNGIAMTTAQIARAVGEAPALVAKLLAELESAGVCSRDGIGAIFSRRMERDERLRDMRASLGELGADHGIKGKEFGVLGGRPKQIRGVQQPPIEPPTNNPPPNPPSDPPIKHPPSVSSSASSSELQNRGSDRTPHIPEEANGSHPAIKKSADQPPKPDGKGQNWSSMAYVEATAKSLAIQRRPQEMDADFKDRVVDAVKRLQVVAEAEAAKRAH